MSANTGINGTANKASVFSGSYLSLSDRPLVQANKQILFRFYAWRPGPDAVDMILLQKGSNAQPDYVFGLQFQAYGSKVVPMIKYWNGSVVVTVTGTIHWPVSTWSAFECSYDLTGTFPTLKMTCVNTAEGISAVANTGVVTSNGQFTVGADNGGASIFQPTGRIDELGIWNRNLTPIEQAILGVAHPYFPY